MYINFNNIFNFRFNAVKYKVLLRDQVISKLREKYPMPQRIYFVQDRCSIHQAAIIQNFCDDQPNFSVITLPAKGPMGFNYQIPRRWPSMANGGVYNSRFLSVITAWRRESSKGEQLSNLSTCMKRRLKSVIDADGCWTKYLLYVNTNTALKFLL